MDCRAPAGIRPQARRLARFCQGWALVLVAALCALVTGPGLAQAQHEPIRVGVYINPPKIFLDENGTATGILPDLLNEIARAENLRLTYVPCEWQQCLAMVQSGALDLMPDVARTPEREGLFAFHDTPALNSWSVLYRREGVTIESVLDLQGLRIAVLAGSVQETYLKNALSGFGISAQFVAVSSFAEGFRIVQAGNADVVAVNHHYGSYAAREYHLLETPIVFLPSSLFFVTGKGKNADLLNVIDYYLDQWKDDPQSPFFRILKKWTGEESLSVVPAYIWWSLAIVTSVVLLMLGIATLLRREVKRQTMKVLEGEQRLDAILNDVGSGIYIKDMGLRYRYANRAMCELLGRSEADVLGRLDAELFDAEEAQHMVQVDRDVIENDHRFTGREVIRKADTGQTRTLFSVKKPLYSAEGLISGVCGIATDITDQIDFREKLDRLANFDPLTGLHNRAFFLQQAEAEIGKARSRAERAALLIINLDSFKDINNSAGHRVGDLLLKEVAEQLDQVVRGKHMLARIMGDSFALLMTGLPAAKSALVAEINDMTGQLQAAIARPKNLEGFIYHGSASIGITVFDPTVVHLSAAFKQAELALYQAKTGERGSVRFFETEMEQLAADRMKLEAELRTAIEAGQLEAYYQPQVDAKGMLTSFEALVRWNHPDRGLCPPAIFVPLAEQSGQILDIGRFVLEAACKQLDQWAHHPATERLVVAVNVSAAEFFDENFVSHVISTLARYKFNPRRLELELTESQFIKNFDQALVKMAALRGMGMRLSLDDFGTGYSSLSRLKQLPFDQLKIDASFVRELTTSPQDAAIIRAIVDLAQALKVEVLAEGVETEAQRDALLALGCGKFQGYLNGAPMQISALREKFVELQAA